MTLATRGYALVTPDVTVPIIEGWKTYNPVITLVGGTGNTVPVYTTNKGRYMRTCNTIFVDIHFEGDGGAEGAGTGQINISLPIVAGANINGNGVGAVGFFTNGTNQEIIGGTIETNATDIKCRYWSSVKKIELLTGDDQNKTTRGMFLHFWYEVDT